MRKKEKDILMGAGMGFAVVALGDVLLQYWEHQQRNEVFNWENFNAQRSIKNGIIGAAAGGLVAYGLYELSRQKERKQPFAPDPFLRNVLKYHHPKNATKEVTRVLQVRNKVVETLETDLHGLLAEKPFDHGSFAKRTANTTGFDLDIAVVFAKSCGLTMEAAYEKVYSTLKSRLPSTYRIKKKGRTINLTYRDERGQQVMIDVVPGRIRNGMSGSGDVTLHKRASGLFGPPTVTKANPLASRLLVVNKPEERSIIRLIKLWRDYTGINLPSSVIEVLVLEAFKNKKAIIGQAKSSNLINCMNFIADQIEERDIKDYTNSNRTLLADLEMSERIAIATQLRKDADRVNKDEHYWKEIFNVKMLQP